MALATVAKCRLRPRRCLLDVLGVLWFIAWSHLVVRFARGLPDNMLRAKRAVHCSACPIFNSDLKTCGTPGETFLDPETGKEEQYGCFCYQPLRARFHVDCWLWKRTGGTHGWPNELNASYYNGQTTNKTRTKQASRLARL
jgi:hypothetical protein